MSGFLHRVDHICAEHGFQRPLHEIIRIKAFSDLITPNSTHSDVFLAVVIWHMVNYPPENTLIMQQNYTFSAKICRQLIGGIYTPLFDYNAKHIQRLSRPEKNVAIIFWTQREILRRWRLQPTWIDPIELELELAEHDNHIVRIICGIVAAMPAMGPPEEIPPVDPPVDPPLTDSPSVESLVEFLEEILESLPAEA